LLWPCSSLARCTGTDRGFRVRDACRQSSTKRDPHSPPKTKPLPSTQIHAGGKGRAYPQPGS